MGLRDYGIISPDKYKERRRQCRMLTVLVLLLMCTTGTGIAVTTEVNISSGDISITDTGYTVGSTFTPWDANDHALTITGASTSNHITVENGTCTLTLSGVTIAPPDEPAISVHARDGGGAKVTLIVTGTNELKGGIGCAAIEVKAGWEDTDWSAKNSGSLEIQGDGTLNVTGGAATQDVGGGAGIGGNGLGKSVSTDGWNFGSILLTDSFTGMIYANGGYPYTKNFIGGGAGIGGGGATANSGDCSGHISICNGTLIAYGGSGMYSSGAGIGTGAPGPTFSESGSSLQISISGGTITATGGERAAGIGGGENVAGGTIDISGGTIFAYGGAENKWGGAGIGGGDNGGWTTITIRGDAKVEAYGGGSAAGIGGRNIAKTGEMKISIEDTATVLASGGSVGGPGIGAMLSYLTLYPNPIIVNITSTNPVTINASSNSRAIGVLSSTLLGAVHLTVGKDAQVWAFNQDTKYSALDWDNVTCTGGAVAVAYTHNTDEDTFPVAGTLHETTHSTDQNVWFWQYQSTLGVPAMIEIFSEQGSIEAVASHTAFYGGNWAYIGTPTIPESKPDPEPETPVPTPSDGNMDDAFRVLFDTNGGNTIQPQTGLSYGDRITQPADPVKNGCIFAGWYCDEACTKPWNFADGIPGDMILYAKWNCEATPPTTATSTATVTLTIQPTPGPTGEPTGRPTRDPQPTGDIGNKPAGTTQHLLGILLFLFLLILLLLILLLRHTVTFFIPAAGKITEYRIKVWHGKHINPDTLPALLRSAAWYLDPERRERWDFDEDRVRKSIKLYLG